MDWSVEMNKTITIVILGAGYAGVAVAQKLAKLYKEKMDVEIVLIDQLEFHTMRTVLHELLVRKVQDDVAQLALASIFEGTKVKFVQDKIISINQNSNKLISENNVYSYDYLVVATGSQVETFNTKGAKEFAHSIWTLEGIQVLRMHLENKLKEEEPIVVVGAGFTGIEIVGELASKYLDHKIMLINSSEEVLPTYPVNLRNKVTKRLSKIGVDLVSGVRVSEIQEDSVILSDGRIIETSTVIWSAGIRGAVILDQFDLEKNSRGQLVANKYLQSKDDEKIFLVGDVISYIGDDGKVVPQMVENAKASANLVVDNINRHKQGQVLKGYKPSLHGSVVSIGNLYGVANLKFVGLPIRLTGLLAAFMKLAIHGTYYYSVMDARKAWQYLKNKSSR